METAKRIGVDCCIVGGGPAGVMLGYLLARAGVDVLVLERHPDFLRDFRGDTVHPSTLEILHELGLLDRLLARPHQKLNEIRGSVGGRVVTVADFGHTPTHCHFIALMPSWDFLNFMTAEARTWPTFQLCMSANVVDLVDINGRIAGVRAETAEGPLDVYAALVVGAGGRDSVVRRQAKLVIDELGVPIDVLWVRLSKRPDDSPQTMGYFDYGRALVMLDRGDYWQCAMIIRKGELNEIRARGLPAFRSEIAHLAPSFADRGEEIRDWGAVKLLTVRIDRLRRWWRTGLLCIGDSAHAMSPVGGVGINLAIQDAVAAANILAGPLRAGLVGDEHLEAVQRRRALPTRVTQELQVLIQNRIWPLASKPRRPAHLPVSLQLFNRFPWLRRVPARLIGVGMRPEHVALPS
jgi:2-polyprenyl-6-methoxyphenol hydroxylase-like FAD-dependent oxidoreductase